MLAVASGNVALVFVELGAIVLGLAMLARLSDRLDLSPIPFYLLAGLAFGEGGIAPLDLSRDFIELTAEIGIVLLLLTLGLEYSAEEMRRSLRVGMLAGVVDLGLNFTPGLAAGLVLGWGWPSAVLLGGITYISSSGVIAKVLADLGRFGNRETPTVLSILVIEDLTMAVYLPAVSVMLAGLAVGTALFSVTGAVLAAFLVLVAALRYGRVLTRLVATRSDEALLLTVLGITLVVAGLAQWAQVSAAVGAFLVGVALSGSVSQRAKTLIRPLRDLFAATFFLLFGLEINPSHLLGVAAPAAGLALVTGATKIVTGSWAARRTGVARRGRLRAGTVLMARGEFSIVIAGLGVTAAAGAGVAENLGILAAAYVLILAVMGPVVTKYSDWISDRFTHRFARLRPAGPPGVSRSPRRGP